MDQKLWVALSCPTRGSHFDERTLAMVDADADSRIRELFACVTQGDSDYLIPGRNGVFYDRQGRDWDATIVKVLDNPIPLRQAFRLPYKKLARFIKEQAARRNRRTAVVVSLLLLVTLIWLTLAHERQPATGIMAPGSAALSEPPGPGTVNSPSTPKPATP
jgi:hypothetical protein